MFLCPLSIRFRQSVAVLQRQKNNNRKNIFISNKLRGKNLLYQEIPVANQQKQTIVLIIFLIHCFFCSQLV